MKGNEQFSPIKILLPIFSSKIEFLNSWAALDPDHPEAGALAKAYKLGLAELQALSDAEWRKFYV